MSFIDDEQKKYFSQFQQSCNTISNLEHCIAEGVIIGIKHNIKFAISCGKNSTRCCYSHDEGLTASYETPLDKYLQGNSGISSSDLMTFARRIDQEFARTYPIPSTTYLDTLNNRANELNLSAIEDNIYQECKTLGAKSIEVHVKYLDSYTRITGNGLFGPKYSSFKAVYPFKLCYELSW